jgi:DNA-binding transcriptional LysR family regulator
MASPIIRNRLVAMSVFAEVVEAKSFSAAALKLGISKSLVSRQITALEQALTVKLLNRTTRRLTLTDAGALYIEHCRRVVQEVEYAERRLTDAQSKLAGVVRITCVPAFALRHLMPALGELQTRYPEIRLKLACTNTTMELDEKIDLGIRIARKPDPQLVARKLAVNRKILCAAPMYLARRGNPRSLSELAHHESVLFPGLAPKGAWTFEHDGEQHAVTVPTRFETDDMDAAHAAVRAGLGLGVLPVYVAADDLRVGTLVAIMRDHRVLPDVGIYLVYLPNRTLPARVRVVIEFLTRRWKPVPPWETGW